MASDVFSFHWAVLKTGYRWVSGRVVEGVGTRSEDEWALTENILDDKPMGRHYSPLKEFPGLFQDFARVDAFDPDAILAFANRYGKLGLSNFMNFSPPERPGYTYGNIVEMRRDWQEQILDMGEAVALWNLLRSRNVEALSQCIYWRETDSGGWWIYDTHSDLNAGEPPPTGGRRRTQLIQPVLDLFKQGDVFMPAMFLVQRWVNEHLHGHVAPQLLYDLTISAQVLNIVPGDLAGAMWLQLAQAIAGNKEYVACKECGRWIEVSHRQADRRTKRREFCSDACKSKNYRRKRDHAAKDAAAKPGRPKKRKPAK